MAQNAAFPRMLLPIPRVVRVGGRVNKSIVELRLADGGAEGVNLLEGNGRVEGEGVGTEADYRA